MDGDGARSGFFFAHFSTSRPFAFTDSVLCVGDFIDACIKDSASVLSGLVLGVDDPADSLDRDLGASQQSKVSGDVIVVVVKAESLGVELQQLSMGIGWEYMSADVVVVEKAVENW